MSKWPLKGASDFNPNRHSISIQTELWLKSVQLIFAEFNWIKHTVKLRWTNSISGMFNQNELVDWVSEWMVYYKNQPNRACTSQPSHTHSVHQHTVNKSRQLSSGVRPLCERVNLFWFVNKFKYRHQQQRPVLTFKLESARLQSLETGQLSLIAYPKNFKDQI